MSSSESKGIIFTSLEQVQPQEKHKQSKNKRNSYSAQKD